ncbi:MAG: putative manganese-dependent inorganic diphosphatase [Clostridiales bacterium]|nr:putative manganese-dependent inorganic diphosphatase [Clostridiales bacterium]
MSEQMTKPTIVIGHKNPDTDSICSAIAYARLKGRLTGEDYQPKRCGRVNQETEYVLDTFQVPPPDYIDTLEPRVHDVNMRTTEGVTAETSLLRAWDKMRDDNLRTLPVLNEESHLVGLVTQGDLARSSMEDHAATTLSSARVSARNIVDTLAGELVVGSMDDVFEEGSVCIAAANEGIFSQFVTQNSMVIVGNRSGALLSAIECGAKWLIVCLCQGEEVSKLIRALAEENHCVIILTPYDTFKVAHLINLSMPVRHVMRGEKEIVSFRQNDFVTDIRQVMTKRRIRYFPVVDNEQRFVGLISQRNLLDMQRQQVILVDHNEKTQAVDGIDAAEIVEIIDHHRIGGIQPLQPVLFRNMPLGCTATIVTMMYKENNVEIDPNTAGLLCSAILSDTLAFRSPTCTPVDKMIAQELAQIAGIDTEEHARNMFAAGCRTDDKTEEEIFYQDFKTFNADELKFGIGQVSVIGKENTEKLKKRLLPYMTMVKERTHLDMVFLMLTDIMEECTELLYLGEGSRDVVQDAFNVTAEDGSAILPGVLSRKKQTMPSILMAIQRLSL